MSTVNIVLLVILAVLIVGLIVLYFLGKKAQKKRVGKTPGNKWLNTRF